MVAEHVVRGHAPSKFKSLSLALVWWGCLGLGDEQTWTNLIEKHFDDRIHFDNYGIGFNKTNSTIKILQSISRRNIPYDIVILNISPDTHSISLKNALSMTYQARWDDQKYGPCAFRINSKNFGSVD